MAKIKKSILKGREPKSSGRKIFAGDISNSEKRVESFVKNKIPYLKTNSGGVVVLLDCNENEWTYIQKPKRSEKEQREFEALTLVQKKEVIKKEKEMNSKVMNCCKDVLGCVKKFELEKGELPSVHANPQGGMGFNILEHIGNGETKVSLVDINHCYWRIAYNEGIISEKVYERWKNEKLPRLKAVGNLNKTTTIEIFDGKKSELEVVKNKHRWVWNFLVWKTHCIMLAIKRACNNDIFAYHTDGIYLPSHNVETAIGIIETFGLQCKVEEYEVVGYNGVNYVLQNVETKKLKRARLGDTRGVDAVLRYITTPEIEEGMK